MDVNEHTVPEPALDTCCAAANHQRGDAPAQWIGSDVPSIAEAFYSGSNGAGWSCLAAFTTA